MESKFSASLPLGKKTSHPRCPGVVRSLILRECSEVRRSAVSSSDGAAW